MNKLAVFVSDIPRSREAKLCYGLQRAGWQVVLLHRQKPMFEASKYCVEVIKYNGVSEALSLTRNYTPVVYHVFSCWDFSVAATLIKSGAGKVVFDDYDVMTGFQKRGRAQRRYPGQLELERFCLENADGLCCRSLETQFVKRDLGYCFRGRRIFFPDYAWGEQKKLQGNNDKSVVYCGNVPSPSRFGYISQIAQTLATIGWDFHIYPSRNNFMVPRDCQLSNLHVHSRQDCRVLIHKMSQHTVGLQIPNKLVAHRGYTDVKKEYSMSGKIFDYLDAGLPVLIADQRVQAWLLRRYGVAIQLDTDDPLKSLSSLSLSDVELARLGVGKARKHLTIANQVSRLIEFYKAISK